MSQMDRLLLLRLLMALLVSLEFRIKTGDSGGLGEFDVSDAPKAYLLVRGIGAWSLISYIRRSSLSFIISCLET